MGDRPRDVGSSRARPPLDVERFHISDRVAMLAALRVVLGLPRVIPNSGMTTCYPMPARAMVST